MFRKEPAALAQHCEALVKQCAELGADILDSAAAALAPGGELVYSTCTFAPEEDEGQVAAFLQRHPEFMLADVLGNVDYSFGSEGEANRTGGLPLDVSKVRRIWPCQGGEGHFMARLVKAGTPRILPAPGEYTRRAFLNGKLSLTQAEAVMDIISADGRQGAALANASLNGALARKIATQKDALTALQAHLAAWVDFPEEDVPELSQSHLCDVLGGVEQELDALIQSYDAGAVLREGVDCAIVGKPNAGKSTLLNLLAGFDRAIVTPVAGTTRDVVEQAVQLGDVRLNLFDTAGLRQTEDEIEAEGIRRSWKKLDEAGLILAVFDGSERPTREDMELAQRCGGRPAIALVNKEDKPTRFDADLIAPYFAMVLPVCCQEEGARKVIAAAVARLLGTNQIDPHAASLSGQRQLSAATRARDAVAGALDAAQGLGLDAVSVCVDDALDALCELTGENASEAVINEVFERFCVGK